MLEYLRQHEQDRDRRPELLEILSTGGIGSGDLLEIAGWHTDRYTPWRDEAARASTHTPLFKRLTRLVSGR